MVSSRVNGAVPAFNPASEDSTVSADHPDDQHIRIEISSNRILLMEELAGKCLVDDHDRLGVRTVRIGERSAPPARESARSRNSEG